MYKRADSDLAPPFNTFGGLQTFEDEDDDEDEYDYGAHPYRVSPGFA
jgi:hypothetical protein